MLRELEKAGLVVRETQARRKVKDKTEQIASLAVDPAEALARMEDAKRCWLAAVREANAPDDRGQADRGKMGSKRK